MNFEEKIKIKQKQTTQNGLQRKKVNCQPKSKTPKILLLAHYQSINFVKKIISWINAGTYKQNTIIITKLVIYQNSVRKK